MYRSVPPAAAANPVGAQLTRERLLSLYFRALTTGEVETVESVLKRAQSDPVLEAMLIDQSKWEDEQNGAH
jgi:hypothetical protein